MNRKTKIMTLVIGLLAGLLLGAGGALLLFRDQTAQPVNGQDVNALYAAAVEDAAFAREDEVHSLVTVAPGAEFVTWDEAEERILLCTWHNYPDSYPVGETVTLEWGTVWTFTPDELGARYAAEAKTVEDWELRLKQLIGFPPDSVHSTFTTFWVDPADICRPAYQPDPTDGGMTTALDGEAADPAFKEWFDSNILGSYFYGDYPWTRLGYTYDWADNGTEYGLSEFLIRQGAAVEVVSTESTETFLSRLGHNG